MSAKPEIETFQTDFELERLVALFEWACPERVLEVGCWHGGTLWHWLQAAELVVAVDDAMRRAADWKEWADGAGSSLELLQGASQDEEIVSRARELGPYGFVFIDADHRYESVKADWENFAPLVARGGLLAFHDIRERPDYGVSRLWAEIKGSAGARTVEIIEVPDGDRPGEGIGVVWL